MDFICLSLITKSTGILHQITLMGKPVAEEAQLFNLSGQLVKSFRLTTTNFQQSINLENIDIGVYFLIIAGKEGKQQLKIVKQ